MRERLSYILAALCLVLSLHASAQNWKLQKEADGMKIYTGASENSNVKALKVEYTVEGTLTELAALLLDVKAQEEWVYSTKHSELLEKISDHELMSYTEKSVPSPFSNRDAVMHVKMSQDPATKILTVNSVAIPGYIPAKKKLVRVPSSKVMWKVTPVGDKLQIVYTAEADPGGNIPAWVANMFLVKGPHETFKKLGPMMQRPAYKNAQLRFISN